MWIIFAILSALFAALTSILAKIGIDGVNSNLATGVSWLCYYKALQMAEASKVVPIDKLSVVITLILAFTSNIQGVDNGCRVKNTAFLALCRVITQPKLIGFA